MRDRVAGAPGRYNAVITLEELEKMQAGETFSITISRDDDPIVEGTPYSKAAVLPDALAEQLCPNIEDPTPADAFSALLNLKTHTIEDADHPGCFYRLVDGEKEWINPPLADAGENDSGLEYRTTKRYFGKPVYVQAGIVTTNPTLNQNVGIRVAKDGDVIDKIVSLTAFAKNNEGNAQFEYPLPYFTTSGGSLKATIAKTGTRTFSLVAHGSDLSGYTFTYCIEYTKA